MLGRPPVSYPPTPREERSLGGAQVAPPFFLPAPSFLPKAPMIRSVLLAALGAVVLASAAQSAPLSPITPAPAVEQARDGSFRLDASTVILTPPGDQAARAGGLYLADLIARSRGLRLQVREGIPTPDQNFIQLQRQGPSGEAYGLDVIPGAITIAASDDAGLFYGAVTVWQLATPRAGQGAVDIPALQVEDAPRFAWRGLMLDSARNFQSVAFLKRFIDRMALEKLNTLHWHLTDDQGWRIEIRKYPRLTEVGAWRVPAGAGPAADLDPKTGKPRQVGGFYTQDQIREVVAYAAARHVTIVPEIDLPGHATAAIAAYPQLASGGPPPSAPGSDWGVYPNLYNVDETTFAFLEDVLDEVMALFPSRYIHLGGDEAVKPQWKASASVQARMKELHIGGEDALQGWFMSRLEQHLNAKGRRMVGWDEILDGGVAKSATVMSWRGIDGAIVAAKLGHDTVLSPWPTLYFDNRNSASPAEPPGRGRVVSLKEVYDFDPMPAALSPTDRAHVLGLQANVWTEHIRTEARVEAMTWPRATAAAETGWTPEARRSWNDFADRLPAELDRWRALGLGFDEASLQVRAVADPTPAGARVTLAGGETLGEIRYSLDGSALGPASRVYGAPFDAKVPATIRAAVFRNGQALAPPVALKLDARSIRTRMSQELQTCTDKLVISLEDDAPVRGDRAVMLTDIMNPCWIYPAAPLSGVRSIEVAVGQLPFNFQIGDDIKKIAVEPPTTPDGELVVRQDSCQGPVLATLPLAPATRSQATTVLKARLPAVSGDHDLCLSFTRRGPDPIWAIDRVTLVAGAPHGG
jgi:hexosaminidase